MFLSVYFSLCLVLTILMFLTSQASHSAIGRNLQCFKVPSICIWCKLEKFFFLTSNIYSLRVGPDVIYVELIVIWQVSFKEKGQHTRVDIWVFFSVVGNRKFQQKQRKGTGMQHGSEYLITDEEEIWNGRDLLPRMYEKLRIIKEIK